jgi:hypothetical protein
MRIIILLYFSFWFVSFFFFSSCITLLPIHSHASIEGCDRCAKAFKMEK